MGYVTKIQDNKYSCAWEGSISLEPSIYPGNIVSREIQAKLSISLCISPDEPIYLDINIEPAKENDCLTLYSTKSGETYFAPTVITKTIALTPRLELDPYTWKLDYVVHALNIGMAGDNCLISLYSTTASQRKKRFGRTEQSILYSNGEAYGVKEEITGNIPANKDYLIFMGTRYAYNEQPKISYTPETLPATHMKIDTLIALLMEQVTSRMLEKGTLGKMAESAQRFCLSSAAYQHVWHSSMQETLKLYRATEQAGTGTPPL